MSGLLPLSTYNLAVNPFEPVPAIDDEFPVTIRLTLAAVDPESVDEAKVPSTLRILKKSVFTDDDLYDSSEDELDDDEEESEEEEEEEVKKESPKKSPKKDSPKKESPKKESKKEESEDDEDDEDMELGSDDDSDLEDDVEEYVVCTLGPGIQYQQTLDLTITPEEEVYFVATGSYAIHLTGNYIEHPYDGSSSSDEDDYSDDEDELDSDEYDLTPDEDEVLSGDEQYGIDDLEDVDDIEGKIEEIIENEKKTKKSSKKRDVEEAESKKEEPAPKKSKKEQKKVEFSKELEQGPTGSTAQKKDEPKKFPTKTLIGGVTIEDRTMGKGPNCKAGQKVGVRYIGKLKNGKVFDKNTSGKPFVFGLGKGEVIKGWDVGVAGMSVGGERRIVIPAPMAYGKQKLPGIPANSELTFDVKLVSIK